MTGRRGRRRKQLLCDLKEKRGYCETEEGRTRSRSVEKLALEEAVDLS